MSRLDPEPFLAAYRKGLPRIGDILVEMGAVTPRQLRRALEEQKAVSAPIGELLRDADLLTEETLHRALARRHGLDGVMDGLPDRTQATDAVARSLPLDVAKRLRAIPAGEADGATVIVTGAPDRVDALRDAVPDALLPCRIYLAPPAIVDARIRDVHGAALARIAEARPPIGLSARNWRYGRGQLAMGSALLLVALAVLAAPATALALATLAALVVTVTNLALRLAALAARIGRAAHAAPDAATGPLPRISILVPLADEGSVLPALIERLSALDYPRVLLDLLLVIEADDTKTLRAAASLDLPRWVRIVAVPDGHPRTKPRAMNYALDFARGDIVGVYDAEDAPDPDQLRRVAARFAAAGPEVACLQGVLDFYNARHNLLSRWFAIEYAVWFRLVLPGLAALRLIVPLGGTTLFFRRTALEAVGAWDAHNVTEDADLGVRLARSGFRTELIDTVTREEANAAPLAWIRQRSRWLKGYAITWLVHMRDPVRLWRDVGAWRFVGFQILFVGALLGTLLLPFAWSTGVVLFGIDHPVLHGPTGFAAGILVGIMVVLTAIDLAVNVAGTVLRGGGDDGRERGLWLWAVLMPAYYPLHTAAAVAGLADLTVRPFHWAKTAHGRFGATDGRR